MRVPRFCQALVFKGVLFKKGTGLAPLGTGFLQVVWGTKIVLDNDIKKDRYDDVEY